MKKQTLVSLTVVLVVLLVAALIPLLRERIGVSDKKNMSGFSFDRISAENTNEIRIQTPNQKFSLKKDGETWNVNGYVASQKAISTLFSSLSDTSIGNVVSKNPANIPQYNLASDSGVLLSFISASEESTIVIGKNSQESGSFYMKRGDDINVYIATGPLKDSVKMTADDWRDKVLVSSSPKEISSIEVVGKKSFSYSELESVLSRMVPLEGRIFATPEEIQSFDKMMKNTMIIKGTDQNVLAELVYIEKDGDYWMQKKGANDVLKVSGFKLQDFFKLLDS